MCYACRIALSFGWLCFLDLSVLFWPIAHNSFLHQLTGVPYPVLIRFHRYQNTLQVPCHSDHLLTHDDATLLHNMLIYDACCVTGNIPNCMSNVALATHGVKAPWQQLAKFQNSSVWTVMMCLSSRDTHHVLCSISGAWQLALHLIACSCKLVPQAAC
jgi:hypothetical protein